MPELVDLGCGAGSDVVWFARQGVPASGLDFVRKAYERAERVAREESLPATFLPFNLLEIRSVLATSALVASRRGQRVLLARHLVDAVSPAARRELWRCAPLMLDDGGRLYLQFLVRNGEDGYGRRLKVRPVKPRTVARRLRARGATIVHREVVQVAGSAADVAGGRPSKICRMVAQWEQ